MMAKPTKARQSMADHSRGVGYDLLPDGSYELAPCDRDSYDAIASERAGIREYLRCTQDYAQKRLAELELRNAKWWRTIAAMLDRPDDVFAMEYMPGTGRVIFREPKQNDLPAGSPPPAGAGAGT